MATSVLGAGSHTLKDRGHHAYVALPTVAFAVDGEHQLDVVALLPLLDVIPVGEVGGMRRAIEDGDAGVVGAVLSTTFTNW